MSTKIPSCSRVNYFCVQNQIVKEDQVIVSVSEDSVNVLEEHSSAQELQSVTSTKENKMYNSVNSLTGSEGKREREREREIDGYNFITSFYFAL
jgi:hypothetical protein